ncbi:uncharacterized protein LOC134303437 [Trichomycterus rosablanca]|uniref:uncharacterized protein LOC134303437 n=1 Tax=Trichomycterus rosablanca TaxID=2290929 RepID=UPI002F35977A
MSDWAPPSPSHFCTMSGSTAKYMWCSCRTYKIEAKDTHDKCLLCLGIQHAKEAVLEYGKCPHCAKMDWNTCIKRLTKVQEVIHLEAQQRKTEETQTGVRANSEPVAVTTRVNKVQTEKVASAALTASQAEMTSPPSSSSAVPAMTLFSSSPGVSENDAALLKGDFVPQASLQQTADQAPSGEHEKSACPVPFTSHKKHRSSRCTSCRRRHCRSCCCKKKRSPSSSCSSSRSSSECLSEPLKEKRAKRESRKSAEMGRQHWQLLDFVHQKLETQQRAMQVQWSTLENRLNALERKGISDVLANPDPAENVLTISQGQQTGPVTHFAGTGCVVASVVVKQEDRSRDIPCFSLHGEGGASLHPGINEAPRKDVLVSKDLQDLIIRAAKHLGVEFPRSPNGDPLHPIMKPEFEEFVQFSWSSPANSKAFSTELSDLYKLHERQSPAYDHMPKVNKFMTTILQAVHSTKNKVSPSADHIKLRSITEGLVENAYEAAGMLAKTANYLHYLSDYQNSLLEETSKVPGHQRLTEVLEELKLIGHFMFQLSSHQAELSGRVMAASVVVSRYVWMANTNCPDSLKQTILDLPFVVDYTDGENGASTSDATCAQKM